MLREYETGTVSVTAGDAHVIGAGTSWLTYADAGDTFIAAGVTYIIQSIESIYQLTLDRPYEGMTAAGIGYRIIRQP